MEDEDTKINSNISYSPVWINATNYNTTSSNTIKYAQPTYTYNNVSSGDTTTYYYSDSFGNQMKTYYDIYQTTIAPREEVEFEDCYPAITKVKDMCKEYPALHKAWEQFKLTYRLTVSDYDAQKDDV